MTRRNDLLALEEEVLIELGTNKDRLEKNFLLFLLPFWAIYAPMAAVHTIYVPFAPFLLTLISLSCLAFLCFQLNNKIGFGKETIQLPGVMPRVIKCSDIESVYIETGKHDSLVFFLKDEAVQARQMSKRQSLSLKGLTVEDARLLWHCLTKSLGQARIDFAVRRSLYRWGHGRSQVTEGKGYGELLGREIANRDLAISLDLSRVQRPASWLGYVAGTWNVFLVSWVCLWTFLLAATVLTALNIHILAVLSKVFSGLGSALQSLLIIFCPSLALNLYKVVQITFLTQTIWMVGAALMALLSFLVVRSLWRLAQAQDQIFIDYLGITSRIKTPGGYMPAAFIAWKNLAKVTLKRSGASRDGVLIFSPKQEDKLKIELPLGALNNNKVRAELEEAIQCWGVTAAIGSEVLEAIRPAKSRSFTDLWINSLSQAPALADLTPLSPGDSLEPEPYVVEKFLGAGGEGVTYLVEDRQTKHKMVLKEVILPSHAGQVMKERSLRNFQNQARLLSQIDHEGIARLKEHFVRQGRAYLVLEYIEGESLAQLVDANGPLTARRTAELALAMAGILEHLHSLKPPVLHRDFTPHNLIIEPGGKLKLIDFGVALEDKDLINQEKASMVGKQSYMPLEQIRGKGCTASDIYAFGCCLYFMLSGSDPEPLKSAVLPSNGDGSKKRNLSETLGQIIEKCTRQKVADRFQTAAEIRALLEEALKENEQETLSVTISTSTPEADESRTEASLFSKIKLVVVNSSCDGEKKLSGQDPDKNAKKAAKKEPKKDSKVGKKGKKGRKNKRA